LLGPFFSRSLAALASDGGLVLVVAILTAQIALLIAVRAQTTHRGESVIDERIEFWWRDHLKVVAVFLASVTVWVVVGVVVTSAMTHEVPAQAPVTLLVTIFACLLAVSTDYQQRARIDVAGWTDRKAQVDRGVERLDSLQGRQSSGVRGDMIATVASFAAVIPAGGFSGGASIPSLWLLIFVFSGVVAALIALLRKDLVLQASRWALADTTLRRMSWRYWTTVAIFGVLLCVLALVIGTSQLDRSSIRGWASLLLMALATLIPIVFLFVRGPRSRGSDSSSGSSVELDVPDRVVMRAREKLAAESGRVQKRLEIARDLASTDAKLTERSVQGAQ
jgi:hypothetical protein